MIRVAMPAHLRTLARVSGEISLEVPEPVTLSAVLDELERQFPVLRGAVRDHVTLRRRPFIRFFACENDLSHDPADTVLPDEVKSGKEPLLIVGAIAGGSLPVFHG